MRFHLGVASFAIGAFISGVGAGYAADLTIQLQGDVSLSRKKVLYTCDEGAPKLGLPSGTFPVEYINGGGNSLVVVPVAGKTLIFANVVAGSGARYTAQQYTWWDAKGEVTFSSMMMGDKARSVCRPSH